MTCHHIMIDLETEGTRAGCAIRQIGAASFNPHTGEVGRKFEVNLNTDEQYRNLNMDTDPETINWLKALPANIQYAMTRDPKPVGPSIIALIRAFDWDHKDMRLWCHGATFDEPILRELIVRFGVESDLRDLVPWQYWQVRDTRTILELTGVKVERDPTKAHTGLEDCLKQIEAVTKAYQVIAGWKNFKDYVHQRLDRAGIPHHPNGPHTLQGCRIGDRLDIALSGLPDGPLTPRVETVYDGVRSGIAGAGSPATRSASDAFPAETLGYLQVGEAVPE